MNLSIKNIPSKQRFVWMDLLKVIAILMMIANHCVDNVTPIERSSDWYLTWGTFYNTFTRPAIPIFVMVTGALLLPIKITINEFYRKRILRVIVPFFIWSVLYNLFPWITGLLGLDSSFILLFFKWVEPSQQFSDALMRIAMIPITFSNYCLQMWYVYLLIGIYLYLPFFSTWLKNSTKKEQHLFLLLWFISLFIPYLREYISSDLWGVCSWNEFGTLYSFCGFNGYLLLGYHLVKHPINWSWKKLLAISLPMFIVGYSITFVGFKSIITQPNQPASLVELFFTFCSPNVLLMSVPIFLWCQKANSFLSNIKQPLQHLSICTFGVWMCHYFFVGPSFLLIQDLPIHTMFKLVLATIFTYIIALSLTSLVLKSKNYGKWIMG